MNAEIDELTARLWREVKKGNAAGVLAALEQGAAVDARDKLFRTPLMLAVKGGNQDVISLLLAHGADVNAQNSTGDTPLIYALLPDYTKVVKLLMAHGADTALLDKNGQTASKHLTKKQLALAAMTLISTVVFVQGQRRPTKDKDVQKAGILAFAAWLLDLYVTYQKYGKMKKLLQGPKET